MISGVLGTNELLVILILLGIIAFVIIRSGGNLKKVLGILFLIIGLIVIGLGISALTDVNSRTSTIDGILRDNFNDSYRSDDANQKTAGTIMVTVGGLFFIVGLIMVASKSGTTTKEEYKPVIPTATTSTQTKPASNVNDMFAQLERLGKLKEQGILSEEEFQEQKKKILG